MIAGISPKQCARKGESLPAGHIIETLRSLEEQLRRNERLFDELEEGDLVEACIYEEKALRSRYRYYHTMARRLGLRWEGGALWKNTGRF